MSHTFEVVQTIEEITSGEVTMVNYYQGNDHAAAISALVQASTPLSTDYYRVTAVRMFIEEN